MQGIQSCLNEEPRTFPREDIDNRGEQKNLKTWTTFKNFFSLTLIHPYKIKISQMNSAFTLIQCVHNFTVILCFLYWQTYIRFTGMLGVFGFNVGVE